MLGKRSSSSFSAAEAGTEGALSGYLSLTILSMAESFAREQGCRRKTLSCQGEGKHFFARWKKILAEGTGLWDEEEDETTTKKRRRRKRVRLFVEDFLFFYWCGALVNRQSWDNRNIYEDNKKMLVMASFSKYLTAGALAASCTIPFLECRTWDVLLAPMILAAICYHNYPGIPPSIRGQYPLDLLLYCLYIIGLGDNLDLYIFYNF